MRSCSISFWHYFLIKISFFSVIFSSLLPFTPQQNPKPLTTHTKFVAFSRRFLTEIARCFEAFFLHTTAYYENQINYITEVRLYESQPICFYFLLEFLKLRFSPCSYQVCCYCYRISLYCSKEEEDKKVNISLPSIHLMSQIQGQDLSLLAMEKHIIFSQKYGAQISVLPLV